MNNNWKVILLRECIDIFIGDVELEVKDVTTYDYNAFRKFSMPYMSGPNIVDISNKYGLNATYAQPQQSRWQYMHDLISYCINEDKIQSLLVELFDISRFQNMLRHFESPEYIGVTHELIIDQVINKINTILFFRSMSLSRTDNGAFYIKTKHKTAEIEAPVTIAINHEYIDKISFKAKKDIVNGEFDSALTKARTLLEEVFCYVIEENGETPSQKGDIGRLFNQVKTIYDMHQKKDADKRINNLLSGLEKILTSIGKMRNQASDSHGVGSNRINIEEHHARLYVNTAITFAEFILSIHINKNKGNQ